MTPCREPAPAGSPLASRVLRRPGLRTLNSSSSVSGAAPHAGQYPCTAARIRVEAGEESLAAEGRGLRGLSGDLTPDRDRLAGEAAAAGADAAGRLVGEGAAAAPASAVPAVAAGTGADIAGPAPGAASPAAGLSGGGAAGRTRFAGEGAAAGAAYRLVGEGAAATVGPASAVAAATGAVAGPATRAASPAAGSLMPASAPVSCPCGCPAATDAGAACCCGGAAEAAGTGSATGGAVAVQSPSRASPTSIFARRAPHPVGLKGPPWGPTSPGRRSVAPGPGRRLLRLLAR